MPLGERGATDVPHGTAATIAKTPGLVPIHVVSEVEPAKVTLVSPGGWHVEGLDLNALTALLRSLV